MTTHVISHRSARGKRDAWQRFAAIAVAAAAVAWASWQIWRPPAHLPEPVKVEAPLRTPLPLPAPAELSPAFAAPALGPAQRRPARAPAGIPLDAAGEGLSGDDYDVLSAAELAAISQAREEDRASQFAP